MTRIAINRFGRIGWLTGVIPEPPESGLELVGINDLAEPYALSGAFLTGWWMRPRRSPGRAEGRSQAILGNA
jgi:hypothetical protein